MTPPGTLGKRWIAGSAVLGAGAIIWFAVSALPWPARAMVLFLLLILPVIVLARRDAAAESIDVPRNHLYLSSAGGLWLLAGLAAVAASASGFTGGLLGLTVPQPLPLVGWTLAVILAGILVIVGSYALGVTESPLLHHLQPRTRTERIGFAGLSVTAGVAEEFVFRGFLIPALTVAIGSVWIAAVPSSIAFGVLHLYQGAAGAVRGILLGFILALPLILTGSVLPSMIAHAAINLISGLWLGPRLLLRRRD